MAFILPQSTKHNNRNKAAGKLRRAGYLAKVPTDFTASDLALANNLKLDAAQNQIRKMLRYGEATEVNTYSTPRWYRKATSSPSPSPSLSSCHEDSSS